MSTAAVSDAAVALGESAGAAEPSPRSRSRVRWADGVELMAVGGGTWVLLPLAWWCRQSLGVEDSELLVGYLAFHAASLINDPHFAATYLLFYRDAKNRALGQVFSPGQRRRYWLAGVVVPLLLVAWAGAALLMGSAKTLGVMIQLMFFLVGWHYVKQGFGVLIVLSARRGVGWARWERNIVLAHCFAGWAYAWGSPADPGTKSVVNGVFYTSFAHPLGLELGTRCAFGLSALALLGMLAQKWRRESRLPPLAALCGLLTSIWLWTVFSRLDPLVAYVIPALHSLQYLYFVGLLTRNAAREAAGPPSFKGNAGLRLSLLAGSALVLGWLMLRGVPAWLDGTLVLQGADPFELGAIGPTPYLAAFVGCVNIHHYFMDHVIWRRDNPEMRHLSQL